MELNNQSLEEYLKNAPASEYLYNEKVDYFGKYNSIKSYLDDSLHSYVTIGSTLIDNKVYLNDHGKEHVGTVIKRATDLVCCSETNLNPKEIYYLLCAIQFHDVGNIFGRYKHELRSVEIIKQAGILFSNDTAEQKIIWEIAKSHGGRDDMGGKDTIAQLKPNRVFANVDIRTQFIASILRFADELADDSSRAAKWPLDNGIIPEQSRVFHKYSEVLNSVKVNKKTHSIELHFFIIASDLICTFGKLEDKVFLIDEVFQRIVKMHHERIYCMRYMNRYIYIDKIEVFMEFLSEDLGEVISLPKLEFTITENGYPEYPPKGIYNLCPILLDNGHPKDGMYFFNKLKNK